MKINAITPQYKPQFKANNDFHVLGYDDEESQIKRDYIREWHDKQYMPYQNIYEKEGRKSEFELKLMINDLVQKPILVNNKQINDLNLQNLRSVNGSIYRGAMLHNDELHKVGKLHEAGIRTIIPIGNGFSELKKECEKFSIDYVPIDFDLNERAFKTIDSVKISAERFARYVVGSDEKAVQKQVKFEVNLWKKISRNFINKFTNYIQAMQKGNVYMGCDYGTYNTSTALMFDYLFNPKMQHDVNHKGYNINFVECAENLYHNLMDADKIKMGWTKDFDETFFKRLGNLKRMF